MMMMMMMTTTTTTTMMMMMMMMMVMMMMMMMMNRNFYRKGRTCQDTENANLPKSLGSLLRETSLRQR